MGRPWVLGVGGGGWGGLQIGGNAKTFMIANINPADHCSSETLSTLRFASFARCVCLHGLPVRVCE